MKIFISSVRRGLEDERDALPGMVRALGHEPRRFEDYTAQPVPSREACLRGVEDADAYVLLLGERYGEPLPDTGKAPTEEEWTVARRRGIPIVAFRKTGVTPEPSQGEFVARVEDYRSGVFRATFASVADLLTGVAGAIRQVASASPVLTWRPLTIQLAVPWRNEGDRGFSTLATVLEFHVVPVAPRDVLQATVLTQLPKRLTRAGREHGLFSETRGVESTVREDEVVIVSQRDRTQRLGGLRVARDRTISVWGELDSDMLGTILDAGDLSSRVVTMMRIAGELDASASEEVALAIGLQNLSFASEGRIADLGRRSSGTVGLRQTDDFVRVEPRDTVPFAVLIPAADEIARELAMRLLLRFRSVHR